MKYFMLVILNLSLVSFSFAGAKHGGGDGHEGMKMDKSASPHWMAPEAEAARKNPVKFTKKSVARGSALYKKSCANCHGAQGKGDGPVGKMLKPKPANLLVMSGNHPDGDFAWKIAMGKGAMPPWKSILKTNQIWDLVNYIQSLSGAKKADGDDGHGDDHGH